VSQLSGSTAMKAARRSEETTVGLAERRAPLVTVESLFLRPAAHFPVSQAANTISRLRVTCSSQGELLMRMGTKPPRHDMVI